MGEPDLYPQVRMSREEIIEQRAEARIASLLATISEKQTALEVSRTAEHELITRLREAEQQREAAILRAEIAESASTAWQDTAIATEQREHALAERVRVLTSALQAIDEMCSPAYADSALYGIVQEALYGDVIAAAAEPETAPEAKRE